MTVRIQVFVVRLSSSFSADGNPFQNYFCAIFAVQIKSYSDITPSVLTWTLIAIVVDTSNPTTAYRICF